MLSVAGRPILEHNVRLLVRHGISDITINLHHHPDVVTSHFGDGERYGANITYSREAVLRGTGGAVDNIREMLGERFVVLYGDNLTTCDISLLLQSHRDAAAAGTLAVTWREDVTGSGIVAFDETGKVNRFKEKPAAEEAFSNWVSAGVMAFETTALAYVPRRTFSDLSRDVLPAMLNDGERLQAFKMESGLWWIDSIADYRRTLEDPLLATKLADSMA
jgi:mannose-1-phosphate guanylyltransferase/phosphomannomutase